MSEVSEMIQRAKEIHYRLLFPPNAVEDQGIDLKRKLIPPEAPPTPTTEKIEEEVIEHQLTFPFIPPPQPKPLNIKPILRAIASYYGIFVSEIIGLSRTNKYVRPRHVACYFAIRHAGMSYPQVGRRIKRDHTTVLHAVRKISERMLVDFQLAHEISQLELILGVKGWHDSDHDRPTLAPIPEPHLAQPGKEGLSGC